MAHFRDLTRGHPVIMGRGTWDSLPPRFRPLPDRDNIVLTRDPSFEAAGALVAHGVDEALRLVENRDAWVVGGGEVYALFLPLAQRVERTLVSLDVGGDTRAPTLDPPRLEAHRARPDVAHVERRRHAVPVRVVHPALRSAQPLAYLTASRQAHGLQDLVRTGRGDDAEETRRCRTLASPPDQRHQTCAVPPSPQLREQWARALEGANEAAARTDGAAPFLRIERDPRPLGFNDGVIVPPEEFPVGTSADGDPRRGRRPCAAARDRAGRGRPRRLLRQAPDDDEGADGGAVLLHRRALPHGSVKEYYKEVTNGLVQLDGVVVGPYRMPHTLAWYAANGSGVGKNGTPFRSPNLAHDAAVAANKDVDFSPYDNDHNGFVDAFIVVHAGQGAEETGALGDIWSHKSTLATAYKADSSKIYGYLTIPEDAKIGVSAHELGHLLFGFPDLYDTDYSSSGIGDWCLMAGGSWNGAVPGEQPSHPSAWCKVEPGLGDHDGRLGRRSADRPGGRDGAHRVPALEGRRRRVRSTSCSRTGSRPATTPRCPVPACCCGTSTSRCRATPTRTTTRWASCRPTDDETSS